MKAQVTLIVVGGLCSEALHKCGNPYILDFFRTSIVNVCGNTTNDTSLAHKGLLYSSEKAEESIFDVLKKDGKESAVYSALDEFKPEGCFCFGCDSDAVSAVIEKEEKPDFTIICLGDADAAGHKYGFMSEEYLKAVSESFDNVKKIRDAYPLHKLMVISDRGGHGKEHGVGVDSDITIPVILNRICGVKDKIDTATIFDIAPTVARMLGVEGSKYWEGESFV